MCVLRLKYRSSNTLTTDNQSVIPSVLANHHAEQSKLITEHESNMRKILRCNEGVWYSDF